MDPAINTHDIRRLNNPRDEKHVIPCCPDIQQLKDVFKS